MRPSMWKLGIILLIIFPACKTQSNYEKQADGVVLKFVRKQPTAPRLMKVQVCAENIIRIVATAEERLSERPSLMIEKTSWEPVDWKLAETDNGLALSTAKVTVKIDRATGALGFFKADGSPIPQEKAGGGKILRPAEVMGEKTFHVQQLFQSPDDEAFYGLGQHQNGYMNYKGRDVDLWQHNIVVANPMLVSSRNYGLLWDNNSRTKFGDPRDFLPLSTLKLFDKDGNAGGLTAEYFRNADFTGPFAARREPTINHEYSDVHDPYPEGFRENVKAVRWSGEIEAAESGVYKFRLFYSGNVKMWLDDELVVDNWRALSWTRLLNRSLAAGRRCRVRIEWEHQRGDLSLTCLPPQDPVYDGHMSLFSDVGDGLDYYFIAGDNPDQVIRGYRFLTGKAPMTPKWALGFWQCRERYKTQDELLGVLREFRRRGIPLDNIVQDWHYWKEDQWGSHAFEESRYPDPAGMVKAVHDLRARIMISIWPKFYVGTQHYDEFREKGWLYMRNVEKEGRDWVGPGYVSTVYDPYSEGARALYWGQIKDHLLPYGFDAWWLDVTEPEVQAGLSWPETLLRQGPTALGTAARYLNAYSLLNSKAVYEGQREAKPDQRVFILTRSAFAGQQRYAAATWSGDVSSSWEFLRLQIPAGLNFCLAGIPYWGHDIGGFSVEARYHYQKPEHLEEWRELNTRWFQFGAFTPVFRSHGQFPYREMFNIAPENHPAYQAMLAYDRLRYRLMPYLYSVAGMITRGDYTMMRGLVMDFGADPKARDIADQYLFGPAMMVCPVTEFKARSRTVYLPEGTGWYEFKTGRHQAGGRTLQAEAPYADIPLYVRDGSIIPVGPAMQYTDEKPADPIRLLVYAGADGTFTLYEDESVNNNCERGKFAEIPIRYDDAAGTLTIGERTGEFDGMLKERAFEIVFLRPDKATALDFDARPDQTIAYDGSARTIALR